MATNDNLFIKTEENEYALAICYIEFKDTFFGLAVKKCDKDLAETIMQEAYDCWCTQDVNSCILPNYDADAICQTCYGDFITQWVREKGIPCNEDIDLIPLDGYCMDEPPIETDTCDVSDWRDQHANYYWFRKEELIEHLNSLKTSLDEYLKHYTRDDVDCDILQNLEYVFKLTEKD